MPGTNYKIAQRQLKGCPETKRDRQTGSGEGGKREEQGFKFKADFVAAEMG